MPLLLNYANHAFRTSQRKNSRTGLSVGGFDRVLSYGPKDIDQAFYQQNKRILDEPRGNGLWLWKPYFIARTLREMDDGDWLFYCDAGAYFIHSVQPLLDLAEATETKVMTFADEHPERKYTKRGALFQLGADIPIITDTPQRLGGFSLWKKSSFALKFAEEWLHHAQNYQLISDAENTSDFPNYPEFVAHRHDQSILSILAKKHDFPAFRDPSQWGNNRMADYPNSTYPQLIELTRQRDIPWRTKMKRGIKSLLGFAKRPASI